MSAARKQRRPDGLQKPPARPDSPVRRHLWRLLLLWALAFAAYSDSFDTGLLFDSSEVISHDPRLTAVSAHNVSAILTQEYWPDGIATGLYRPLTTFSYLFNYAVLGNGPRPAGYHWVNFALHGFNVSLVYLLGLLVFEEAWPALVLAAVWGLHPLLTESVTNVVGRADLLSAFGILAGLLCHIQGASAAGRRKLAWLAGLFAAQTVGLFSKENAAVLPAVMLLYDLTWLRRAGWRARAPGYAALILPFAGFFYLRSQLHAPIGIQFVDNPLIGAGFFAARLTAVKVIGSYLWLFLWPAHLSADYSYAVVKLATWADFSAWIALGVCVSAGVLCIRWYGKHKPLFFFVVFFFVALIPASNLVILIGSIMAERFVYLPSVGLAGCLAAALFELQKRFAVTRAAWIAICAVCLVLAARTYARNLDWTDEISLWSSADPESFKAHLNLGNALMRTRLPDAVAEYQAALHIDPYLPELHNNLGNALAKLPGRIPEAVAEYRAALRIKPAYADAHNNLGAVLAKLPGQLPEAIAEYRTALRIDPNNVDAHSNLGSALSQLPGRLPEAISEYQAALRTKPDYAEVRYNLANALAQTPGGLEQAVAEYRTVLSAEPDSAATHCNLGIALAKMGRLPEAISQLESALRIEPEFAQAHYNLGSVLSQIPGSLPEAISHYEAALRIRPDPQLQQKVDRLRAGER
jgi:protein O-mannosyl-transferase